MSVELDKKPPVTPKEGGWAELWQKEDWWAVWLGAIVLIASLFALLSKAVVPKKWGTEKVPSILGSITPEMIPGIVITGIVCLVLFALCIFVTERESTKKFIFAFPVIFLLTIVAYVLGNYAPLRHYGVNDVIWALVIGLLISNTIGTPNAIKGAVRTELYIKTGLVLLGASILFDRLMAMGVLGFGVAWLVTPVVVIFMYWFSQKYLKMQDKRGLAITLATATSVCGVSAAIAAGAASKAKKEEISLAISISLIFTVIMMVGMPALVKLFGISPHVGGAWLGGTIDSTGAVVAAGAVLGEEAMEIASVVKMVQNILIGFIAFAIAVFFVVRYEGKSAGQANVGVKEIWIRMPKFIIGFIAASFIFTLFIPDETANAALGIANGYRKLFFTLAFISIGLESNFKDMAKLVQGGKPLTLYIIGQTFNIVLTLIAAYIFFSGKWFALPF